LLRLASNVGRALYVAYGAAVIASVMSVLWVLMFVVKHSSTAIALQGLASRIMLAGLGVRYRVNGRAASGQGGARVLVANHSSYLDIPLMLSALHLDFAFVTKRELLEWPVISKITRAGRHIPVDRDRAESRGAVVARMVKTLRAGRSVLVFPEGTFSFDERLRPFHRGAFHAAVTAGCPVVPIATRGVSTVWSQHAKFPRPGRIEVVIGEEIPCAPDTGAAGDDPEARAVAARSLAERFISQQCGLPASE
jgi:1-acyl-sn-glycerol-3-phosphate acyltransferase